MTQPTLPAETATTFEDASTINSDLRSLNDFDLDGFLQNADFATPSATSQHFDAQQNTLSRQMNTQQFVRPDTQQLGFQQSNEPFNFPDSSSKLSIDPALIMDSANPLNTADPAQLSASEYTSPFQTNSSGLLTPDSNAQTGYQPFQQPSYPSSRYETPLASPSSGSFFGQDYDLPHARHSERAHVNQGPYYTHASAPQQPQNSATPCGYETPYGFLRLSDLVPIYKHTSMSYPGSPTQPLDPAHVMYGRAGPHRMPRHTSQYSRVPKSVPIKYMDSGYESSDAEFSDSSYSLRRRTRSSRDQKKVRRSTDKHNKSVTYHHQQQRPSVRPRSSRPIDDTLLRSRVTDIKHLDRVVANPIRRRRNPGRKQTVAQTLEVQQRNLRRRERYRESLSPAKRAEYDRNAAIAKGLISEDDDEEDNSEMAG